MPDNAFDKFREELERRGTPLPQGRTVAAATVEALGMAPAWHLLVIPDDGPPALRTFARRSDLVAAVSDALYMELGNIFMFMGSRLVHTSGDYPHLLLPSGDALPLYDQEIVLQPAVNGEVGDPGYRELQESAAEADGDWDAARREREEQAEDDYSDLQVLPGEIPDADHEIAVIDPDALDDDDEPVGMLDDLP